MTFGARRSEQLDAVAADIRTGGGEAFAHTLDVSDAESVATFCDAAEVVWFSTSASSKAICRNCPVTFGVQ